MSANNDLTKEKIYQIVFDNITLTTYEISEKFGIPTRSIAGAKRSYTVLQKNGGVVKEKITHSKKRLEKSDEVVKIAKEKGFSGGGEKKELARERMCVYTMLSDVNNGLCFSFTHKEAGLEKKLLQVLPDLNFIGVECERNVYKEMLRTIKKDSLPIKPYFGYATDILKASNSDRFAHLYLDFCGTLFNNADDIQYTMQNDLVQKNGLICITVCRTTRVGKGRWFEEWKNCGGFGTNIEDTRTYCDQRNENFIHKLMPLGCKYMLLDIFKYRDSNDMCLYVIQRIR
jgi:hypothetical protein